MKIYIFCILLVVLILQSCKNKEPNTPTNILPKPWVTIIHPTIGNIQEEEQINGQIVFLNQTKIIAPISGYVIMVNEKLGDKVNQGKLLFKIQTNESRALQDSNLNPSSQFGFISVYASATGYINTQNIPDKNVFVNEGSVMLTIVKNNDLAIQVNAPFTLSNLIQKQKYIEIELPNKELKTAYFYKAMPTVDAVSQTQQILFKLKKYTPLPENLNVLIKIPILENKNSILISKEAVLANETQDKFWIMKVTKDNLALKIPIKKGIENKNKVEILHPKLSLDDKIIEKGAYGLADSTQVDFN